MLQKIRIFVSWLIFSIMLLYFAGLAVPALPGWQLLPSLLAANVAVIAGIFIVTILFGRAYCSMLCPLGIMQDFFYWLAKRRKKGRHNAVHIPENRRVRYGVLAAVLLSLILGISPVVTALDPYSIFGRIVTDLLTVPVSYIWNGLAGLTETHGGPVLLTKTDILPRAGVTLALAAAYLLVLFILAWRRGRWYCNTVCPVGTLLGTVSRHSLYRPVIRQEDCVHCRLCERNCRSSCIDIDHGTVDTSRCVDCFDCVSICPKGAISFARPRKDRTASGTESTMPQEGEMTRREMLLTTAAAVGTAAAALARRQPIIPALLGSKRRGRPILPPGAVGADAFILQCTGCHLCVSRCPSGVLQPAVMQNGIFQMGQPFMDFANGYCVYNCNFCSQACPAGAIRPLALAAKQKTRIGVAQYAQFHCLITQKGIVCGNCARHCPTHAISMVENKDGRSYPQVDASRCIGCGSCEYHCPADPPAIAVTILRKQAGA